MRRSLASIFLAVALLVGTLDAAAAVTTLFAAKGTTGASAATDTGNAKYVRVQVFRSDAAAAGTASITIQQSTDGTAWYTVATITNPTGLDTTTGDGGEAWSVASIAYTRVYVVSVAVGTYTARVEVQR